MARAGAVSRIVRIMAKGKARIRPALTLLAFIVFSGPLAAQMTQQFPPMQQNSIPNLPGVQTQPARALQNPVEQVAAARRAVQQNPHSAKAYLSLGEALLRTGNEDEAL